MKRLVPILAVLAALVVAGCRSRSAGAPAESGDLRLALAVAGAGSPAAAWVHVHGVTVRGEPVDLWTRAARDADGYSAEVARVPAGTYALGARLLADETEDPAAADADFLTLQDVPVTVLARTSQTVVLLLQQNPARLPPARSDNAAPVVHGLVGSAAQLDSSDAAASLQLAATASDADGDALAFAWAAVDVAAPAAPVGGFSAPAAAATRWSPPPLYQGTVLLTVTAADARGARASLSLRVQVTPRGGFGSVVTVAGVNHAPDVARIEAAQGQLAPGEIATLTAVASDADGDLLSFAWSDGGCGGSFEAQGASSTAAWRAPAAPATCTVTVTVSDLDPSTLAPRGASTTSTLALHVVSSSGRTAPEFVLATQAPAGPVAAGPVWFRVAAVEAAAGDPAVTTPVTDLAWTDGTGRLDAFAPVVAGTWDAVTWTPPACPAGATGRVPIPVIATATGSAAEAPSPPLRSTFTFPVELLCP